ncbi:ankyrin repeat domain-containing protein [Wolbachia endosymbiont (group A) of Beris morrisii]|uniref:ankyrin repeat domain-containing protein n=1 Tax=Wolbachia endosymbiont (group A) of Beris morrisii TaxID=3066139 RepID=UPI00333EB5BB
MTVEKILQKAAKEIYHLRHPSILSLLVRAVFKWIINSRLGVSFLHFAAEKNFYSIIKLLVKHGANVDAADKEGNTV